MALKPIERGAYREIGGVRLTLHDVRTVHEYLLSVPRGEVRCVVDGQTFESADDLDSLPHKRATEITFTHRDGFEVVLVTLRATGSTADGRGSKSPEAHLIVNTVTDLLSEARKRGKRYTLFMAGWLPVLALLALYVAFIASGLSLTNLRQVLPALVVCAVAMWLGGNIVGRFIPWHVYDGGSRFLSREVLVPLIGGAIITAVVTLIVNGAGGWVVDLFK